MSEDEDRWGKNKTKQNKRFRYFFFLTICFSSHSEEEDEEEEEEGLSWDELEAKAMRGKNYYFLESFFKICIVHLLY